MNMSNPTDDQPAAEASAPVQEMEVEPKEPAKDEGDEDENASEDEGAQEEDALFTALEESEEQEERAHPHHEQPTDTSAAPTLLKAGFAKGDIQNV